MTDSRDVGCIRDAASEVHDGVVFVVAGVVGRDGGTLWEPMLRAPPVQV